jgi:hypothetical protein
MAKEGETAQEIKKEILNQSEISLVLDTYDDIFSDFDPRPFGERALSEDFLLEARRASYDKEDEIELRFLIPQAQRNVAHEAIIKQRMHEHFRKHKTKEEREIKEYKKQAVILIVTGTVIGYVAVWLSLLNINLILKSAVDILLAPASWFTIWTGIEHILFTPNDLKANEEFNRKMSEADITFTPY